MLVGLKNNYNNEYISIAQNKLRVHTLNDLLLALETVNLRRLGKKFYTAVPGSLVQSYTPI